MVVGSKRPLLKDLHDHVLLEVADKWRDLGVQLLAPEHQVVLRVIAADHPHDVVSCCKCVLEKWLDTTTDATWNQLIKALRSPSIQLDYLAGQLEQMLITECKTVEFCACKDCRHNFNLYYDRSQLKIFMDSKYILVKVPPQVLYRKYSMRDEVE